MIQTQVTALKVSRDRKVSPLSRWANAAKRWEPMVANAMGLSAHDTCPGETPFCDGCYAARTERIFTSAGRLVAHNTEQLKACGSNVMSMVALLVPLVETFLSECEKAEKKTGRAVERVYRIHWDGDFYSRAYAAAWANVAALFPAVQFWAYTRSFAGPVNVIDILGPIANIAVYLSVDEHNADDARDVAEAFPGIRMAFCATTWDETEVLARKVSGRNAPRCPELTGKVPMVNAEGVGACVTCTLCVWGKNHVRFAIKH